MKKLFPFLFALATAFSMVACSDDSSSISSNPAIAEDGANTSTKANSSSMRRLGTIDQALANAKLSENDLKDLDGLSSTTIYRASNILDGDTMIITFQEGTMDIGKFVHFFINKAEPNSDDGKFYVTKYIAGGEVYVNLGTEEEILQEQQEAFKNSDEYFDYTVTTTIDENEVTFYFTYDTRCQEEETEENCEHYILKIAQNQDND